MVQYTEQ